MKEYMLIGRHLGHSYSASYFNEKFLKEKIDARYILRELSDISLLPEALLQHQELQGFNVTVPYKEVIIPYLTDLTSTASQVGAVNCVKLVRDADRQYPVKLIGHNTDVEGFSESLKPILAQSSFSPRADSDYPSALILGTGGAAKAVHTALTNLDISSLFVSRNKRGGNIIPYSELTPELIYNVDILVNATPIGMFPEIAQAPPFPYQYVRPAKVGEQPPLIAFDLIYNPSETLFMRICKAHRAVVSNGLTMLHFQANASWRFWTSDI